MDSNGNISWDLLKDNIDQARVAETSLIQLHSNTYSNAVGYVFRMQLHTAVCASSSWQLIRMRMQLNTYSNAVEYEFECG